MASHDGAEPPAERAPAGHGNLGADTVARVRSSHNRHVGAGIVARRRRTPLVWRAISWRAGSSAVFLVVAVATVAAAVAGPTYLAAADQSVLQVRLLHEPPSELGYTISAASGVATASATRLEAIAAEIPGGSGPGKRYGPALITMDLAANVYDRLTHLTDPIDLLARSGVCQQIRFSAGACPTLPDQVALSTRTADSLGVGVGDQVTPFFQSGEARLTVSGLYVVPPTLSSYWWGSNPFAFGEPRGSTGELLDDGFVAYSAVAPLARKLPLTTLAQLPLNPSSIRATEVPAVQAELAAFSSRLATGGLSGSTPIGSTFSAVEAEEKQMRGVIAVIGLELVAIALVVLYGVAAIMSEERRPDMAIAELRGFKRRSIAWIALREPAVLLAAAVPVGLFAGWAAVRLVAGHTFVAGTPVTVDSLAVGTCLLTFATGLLASAMSVRGVFSRARRAAASPALESRRISRALLLADVVALVLTAVAITDLLLSKGSSGDLAASGGAGSGGTASNPFAAVAPALVGVAGGILAARVVPVVARAAARATRWSQRLATGLAARGLMRKPDLARRALVPAVAVCLLVFAVASYAVARANRHAQALFSTGAPVVLDVRVAPGADLVSAVRKADPAGQQAMAVATVSTPADIVLAVDTTRFAKIAAWSGLSGTSAAAVARDLSPPTVSPLILSGAQALRLVISRATALSPPPVLQAGLYDELRQKENILDFGTLRAGTNEYTASANGGCAGTCRLDSLTVFWSPSANSTASGNLSFTITAMMVQASGGGAWRTTAAGLTTAGAWQASDQTMSVAATPDGLAAEFHLGASVSPPSILRADAPTLLPAVVTDSLQASNVSLATPDQFPTVGLDGSSITVLRKASAVALPEVGSYGALLDLSLLERVNQGTTSASQFQVWFRQAPSAGLLAALSEEGITVTGSSTAAAAAAILDGSGPALAFELFLLGAVAAALLSLGALVFAIAAGSRKRAVALAALLAAGVPRTTLRRSLAGEYTAVVIAGAAVGAAAGVATVGAALSSLPQFLPGRVGPALTVFMPWGWVLIAAGGALVLLVASALLSAQLVMRRATPDCLRLAL